MAADSAVHIPYTPTLASSEAPVFALFDAQYMREYGAEHVEFDLKRGYLRVRNLPPGSCVLKYLHFGEPV